MYSKLFLLGLLHSSVMCAYSIKELKGKPLVVKTLIKSMLADKNYYLVGNAIEIQERPILIIAVTDTVLGKKFLKLHDKGNGQREYNGGILISKYLPTIKSECVICRDGLELLVQPYIEQIEHKILFNMVENVDSASHVVLSYIDSVIDHIASVVHKTLEYTVKPVVNDHLYSNRLKTQEKDQESGRIESFYKNNKLNLAGLEVGWEELLHKHIIIDGIAYQETLHELLQAARSSLDPKSPRLIAITHGDFQEMNVCTSTVAGKNPAFYLLDCEYSGTNDVLGDAVVFLMYSSVLTAYLGPKYYAEQFLNIPGLLSARKNIERMKRSIYATLDGDTITVHGVDNFGTSALRKKIVSRFIRFYLHPLLKRAKQEFAIDERILEEKMKACIILRLLGVYNISLMDSMDQAKVLSLLFKVVATPVGITGEASVLTKLEKAL